MRDFRRIAEDCLAGKLSGVFTLRNGGSWKSNTLSRYSIEGKIIPGYYVLGKGLILDSNGLNMEVKERVQNFIPDMKKEQITIDIPEGMVAIREETPGEIKIKFIKKPLDYYSVVLAQKDKHQFIHVTEMNEISKSFNKKAEVLSKLTNIRNYFGKPKCFRDGVVIKCTNSYCGVETGQFYFDKPDLDSLHEVVFAEKEHAQEAINILGDELKYLFEPW